MLIVRGELERFGEGAVVACFTSDLPWSGGVER